MKLATAFYRGRNLVATELHPGSSSASRRLPTGPGPAERAGRHVRHHSRRRAAAPGAALPRSTSSAATTSVARIPAAEVRWYPPVRWPGKICAVAMNNSASNERKVSAPDHPAFFLKPPSCLIGHREPIRVRPYYGSVHPEPELAVVIGRVTRDVPATSALDAVFGYTILNDVTGNGMRAEDMFHYWAVYAKKDNPNADGARRAAPVVRRAATRHGHVRRARPVARDEGRDREPRRPQRAAARSAASLSPRTARATTTTRWPRSSASSATSTRCTPATSSRSARRSSPAHTRKSIHHANFQTVAGPRRDRDRRPRRAGEPRRDRAEGARRMAAALSELERLQIRVALEDLNTAFCYHLDHNEVDKLLDL